MRILHVLALGAAIALAARPAPAGQVQRAPAPPLEPLWRSIEADPGFDLFPLLSFNDRDGVAVGAWMRWRPTSESLVWVAAGAGLGNPARAPSMLELGARDGPGQGWFKSTEGRRGFGAAYRFDLKDGLTVTVAAEEASLTDARYLRRVFFFACPGDEPAAPCDSTAAPLQWSTEPDRAAEVRVRSSAQAGSPTWEVALRGVPALLDPPAAYAQVRAEAAVQRPWGLQVVTVRAATAWTSRETPLQSRFFLHGAGPLERWSNPYLRSRGAPLDRIAYFVPGGAHLRAYGRTTILVRRFVSLAASLHRGVALPLGLSGSIGAFAEASWLPTAPDAIGRAAMRTDAAVLFDWARLTAGENEAGGRFSASVLDLPGVLADAGVSASVRAPLGITVELHVPLWASAPEFADRAHDLLDPAGDGEDRALGLRGSLTVRLQRGDGPFLVGF